MVEADENGRETLMLYQEVNPPDEALVMFNDMVDHAQAWVSRIIIGATFDGHEGNVSLCLMTAARLVDHFVTADDALHLYGRSTRFRYVFKWVEKQNVETQALFTAMFTEELKKNSNLLRPEDVTTLLSLNSNLFLILSE